MNNKQAVIESLTFLVESAKKRNIEQGIKTFSFYIDALSGQRLDCAKLNP
jgi:hypothetical protein